MPRPRRDGTPATAPNKRKLNDLFLKRLAAAAPRLRGLGHAPARACRHSAADRPQGLEVHLRVPRSAALVHIGAADAIGLADARKLAANVMFQVAEGKDPGRRRKAERTKGTFEDLAARYVEHTPTQEQVLEAGRRAGRRHLLPRWAKLQAADITRADVKSMMARIDAPVARQSDIGLGVGDLFWAIREEFGGDQPLPRRRAERRPRAASASCRTARSRSSGRRSTTPG